MLLLPYTKAIDAMGLAKIERVFEAYQRVKRSERCDRPLLNIYLTAGYPALHATQDLLLAVDAAGADFIELGMPYSDPLADGPTIQASSAQALRNGITLDIIFEQVAEVRERVRAPIIAMGYYNQVLQYGPQRFVERCAAVGIDGLILPDLPLEVYRAELEPDVRAAGLGFSFLVTPRTAEERVRLLDASTRGFLYVVSSSSTTGSKSSGLDAQAPYFTRLEEYDLKSPRLIGFNISDRQSLLQAGSYTEGGIIGSAFIRALTAEDPISSARKFIEGLMPTAAKGAAESADDSHLAQ